MPHLVILYTANLDRPPEQGGLNVDRLCRALADVMVAAVDEAGKPVFPTGGVRVLAYPAVHSAIADGRRDYAFAYLNLRMGRGRSEFVKQGVGERLTAVARAHLQPLMVHHHVGMTLQIDEGPEVFDAKCGTIHPIFAMRP
jgi:5-carboxymethyl-2-hydroxymuconate isomerase